MDAVLGVNLFTDQELTLYVSHTGIFLPGGLQTTQAFLILDNFKVSQWNTRPLLQFWHETEVNETEVMFLCCQMWLGNIDIYNLTTGSIMNF